MQITPDSKVFTRTKVAQQGSRAHKLRSQLGAVYSRRISLERANSPSRIGLAILFGFMFSVCHLSASHGQPKDEKVEIKNSLLPEAATDAKNFSNYQPGRPYSVAGTVLARTVFQANAPSGSPANALAGSPTNAPGGYHVEVLDWAIPPRKETGTTTLPGAAFFEVRSGSGTLVIGKQRQKLGPGATFSASEGQPVEIKNGGESLLHLRIYMVKG